MEVTHHIGWGCNFRHLSETRKPSIELITDCDFSIDYKVRIIIGAVGNIRSCSKAINNGVQKVVIRKNSLKNRRSLLQRLLTLFLIRER